MGVCGNEVDLVNFLLCVRLVRTVLLSCHLRVAASRRLDLLPSLLLILRNLVQAVAGFSPGAELLSDEQVVQFEPH